MKTLWRYMGGSIKTYFSRNQAMHLKNPLGSRRKNMMQPSRKQRGTGLDQDIVDVKARRILEILPPTDQLDREAKFFVEATRAEAHLLLFQNDNAQQALRLAWDHDPLNYIAHASTLKQFRMIAEYRNENYPWISEYSPPISVHFAGHIFSTADAAKSAFFLPKNKYEDLKTQVSHMIQIQDIGFGYGSLAAGSDILVAETLLDEGAELHITLPVPEDIFIKQSVEPFGMSWLKRFEGCKSNASSFQIVSDDRNWPNFELDKQAALTSMGAAIQLLIWDNGSAESATHRDATIWTGSNRPQFIVPFNEERKNVSKLKSKTKYKYKITVSDDLTKTPTQYDSFETALSKTVAKRKKYPNIKQGINLEITAEGTTQSNAANRLQEKAVQGGIFISQLAANYIAVNHFSTHAADLIDKFDNGESYFALREKG